MILTEAGRLDEALSRLEENSGAILDRQAYFETRGALTIYGIECKTFLALLLTKLGRLEDAERVYWTLIDRNPDNISYYKGVEECQQLGRNNPTIKTTLLDGGHFRPKQGQGQIGCTLREDDYSKAQGPDSEAFAIATPGGCCIRGENSNLFDNKSSQGNPFVVQKSRHFVQSSVEGSTLFGVFYNCPNPNLQVNSIERILLDFVHKFEENGYNRVSLDGKCFQLDNNK
jgi:tetratricopeptide (TPR) repeat protein